MLAASADDASSTTTGPGDASLLSSRGDATASKCCGGCMGVAGISEGDEPSTHVGVTVVTSSVTNAVVAIEARLLSLLLLFPLLLLLVSRIFDIVLSSMLVAQVRMGTPLSCPLRRRPCALSSHAMDMLLLRAYILPSLEMRCVVGSTCSTWTIGGSMLDVFENCAPLILRPRHTEKINAGSLPLSSLSVRYSADGVDKRQRTSPRIVAPAALLRHTFTATNPQRCGSVLDKNSLASLPRTRTVEYDTSVKHEHEQ